jgi:MerR family transcriptional regulator, redox-sensitive transcriptional activator SoxR
MKIGEVARKAGIRPSAIRFYERAGVLPAASRKNGQRQFGSNVELHLTIIKFAREAGFTIAEIKVLTNGFQEGRTASVRWKEVAEKKWDDMESQMVRLKGMQRLLMKSMQCRCVRLEDCGRMMLSQSRQASEARRVTVAGDAPRRERLSSPRSERSTIRQLADAHPWRGLAKL